MKWLFVTHWSPWPLTHGSWMRVYYLSRELVRMGEEVSVLGYPVPAEGEAAYAKIGVKLVPGLTGTPPVRGKARCLLGQHVYDENLARAVSRLAGEYDVVVLVREKAMQYSREARAAGRVIVDVIDDVVLTYSRRCDGMPAMTRGLRKWWFKFRERHYERSFCRDVDCVTFVTAADQACFCGRNPQVPSAVATIGVDTGYFQPLDGREEAGDGEPRVVFLGNMGSTVNQDAATFLINEIAQGVVALQRGEICYCRGQSSV